MWKCVLLLIQFLVMGDCYERKLSTRLNPDCGNCSAETTLVYTRGDGADDSLHQIWDFTRGEPTIIFAVTELDNNVSFAWEDGRPAHFVLSRPPVYSFVLVIHQIWEYADKDDSGMWQPGWPTRKTHASRLSWRRTDLLQSNDSVTLRLNTSLPDTNNGTMNLSVAWLAFTGYSTSLPHLVHSGNSSLLEVSLRDASGGNGSGDCPRLALHLRLASSDPDTARWTIHVKDTLDDEHTPGIFKIVEVMSPRWALLQYRPISYTSPRHEVTASTLVQLGFLNGSSALPADSTAGAWFLAADARAALAQSLLVSFGSRNDGCYTHTNYTSWSSGVVYGPPPPESWSALVWGWLAGSVGGAVVLLLVYCLCRRITHCRLYARFR